MSLLSRFDLAETMDEPMSFKVGVGDMQIITNQLCMLSHVEDDHSDALYGADSDSDVPHLVDNDSSSESDDECCNVSFSAGAEVDLSSIAVDVGGCVNGNGLLDCDTSFSALDISSLNGGLSDDSEHA